MLSITPIPAFADNYIWAMTDHAARTAVVVDPGDAAAVEEFLKLHRMQLTAILVTHHHADHTGGIAALTHRRTIPVFGPANESIAELTHLLTEGDTVSLNVTGFERCTVIAVPGHTRGHIAYVGDGVVFCGDTLFVMGCGRLFEGTAAELHGSLSRLAALPPQTALYCTHEYTLSNLKFALAVEPSNEALQQRAFEVAEIRQRGAPTVPTTVAAERATNPFLRCNVGEVRESAERFANHALNSEVEVFAALRRWKNEFR